MPLHYWTKLIIKRWQRATCSYNQYLLKNSRLLVDSNRKPPLLTPFQNKCKYCVFLSSILGRHRKTQKSWLAHWGDFRQSRIGSWFLRPVPTTTDSLRISEGDHHYNFGKREMEKLVTSSLRGENWRHCFLFWQQTTGSENAHFGSKICSTRAGSPRDKVVVREGVQQRAYSKATCAMTAVKF